MITQHHTLPAQHHRNPTVVCVEAGYRYGPEESREPWTWMDALSRKKEAGTEPRHRKNEAAPPDQTNEHLHVQLAKKR